MKETILIVEDQAEIRELLTTVIEHEHKHNVMAVGTGEEALRVFGEHDISMVLLDQKLPGIHGLEVLERLQQMDENAVVVMMTGYANVETAVTAMKQGALDYIEKPFDLGKVKDVIRRGTTLSQLFREQKEKLRRHTAKMFQSLPACRMQQLFQTVN
jgi:two-component system response regulator AtoC